MKTIEERAKAYAERTWLGQLEAITAANMGCRAGAEAEHAELTRWNDPKEHPQEGKMVLVKEPLTVLSPMIWHMLLMASGSIHGVG